MRLYLDLNKSLDLMKAAGAPPTGGGAGGASIPKTPGAATGGSGSQVVDCPLGPACPDGGRHEMGSEKLQEHTQEAQAKMQTGSIPGDESTGENTGKPGVPPGASNLGSVGAVEQPVKRIPPPLHVGEGEAGFTPVNTGEFHTETVDPSQEEPKGHPDFSAQGFQQDPHGAKTRSMFQGATDEPSVGQFQRPELASSGLKGHVAGAVPTRPGMEKQEVPNPLAASESQTPVDSQPMDHYRLAQVARESGDEEGAKFQEGMARKRTEGMGSEDHKDLANQLHAAGMHEQAQYHENIHQGATAGQKEVSPEKQKAAEDSHQEKMRSVHHEARSKAEKDLSDAKDKHKKLQEKAEELKEKNKQALKDYEEKKAVHSMSKEMGGKSAAPKKPKLAKEEKVPEKPEISEPSNAHERLQHDTHTSRAKRVADLAESHLKNNKDLSAGDRKRLERAHEMAVYHSNIGYTPTAQHKKELSDAENAVSGMGIKQTHEEMQAATDKKNTEAAAKKAEKDRAAVEKQQAKQAKVNEKQQAQQQKMDAKAAAQQPQPPQTDLDHARVADHQSKAKKLREALQAHIAQNPNMSPEDQQKANLIMSELGKHEQLDMVPGKDHVSELKELQQLAGEHAKLPKEGEEGFGVGGVGAQAATDTGGNYAMNMIHQGRALGHGLGASATNPHGAGGQLGSQVINYGVSGVAHAGHRLLHDAHQQEREVQQDQAKGKV